MRYAVRGRLRDRKPSGRRTFPTTPRPCPETGARLRTGDTEAAMGLRVMTVELVNRGKPPYALDGCPTVRVLDDSLEPFDVYVSHGSSAISTIERFDAGPTPLTVRPGETAVTRPTWRNTVTDVTATPATASPA
nr:DUF4232 domain-containing protein [Kitasatospora sp. GP82]